MKFRIAALAVLMVAVAAVRPMMAQAPSKAVKTVAGILMTVNHFPNDEQKKTLTALAAESTTTADEKVLIQALVGMMHSVAAADKAKVEAIAKSTTAPAGVKAEAEILARFLHMANDADKATLKKLAS